MFSWASMLFLTLATTAKALWPVRRWSRSALRMARCVSLWSAVKETSTAR